MSPILERRALNDRAGAKSLAREPTALCSRDESSLSRKRVIYDFLLLPEVPVYLLSPRTMSCDLLEIWTPLHPASLLSAVFACESAPKRKKEKSSYFGFQKNI